MSGLSPEKVKGVRILEFNENNDNVQTISITCNSLIYFLINKKEVIYVGQTNNGLRRPFAHYDKTFDEVKIIPCLPEELDFWEDHFIQKYRPICNRQFNYKIRWGLQRVKRSIRKYKFPEYTLWDLRKILKELQIPTQKDIRNNKETISFNDYKKVMCHLGISGDFE
jgi:hypothetical protein